MKYSNIQHLEKDFGARVSHSVSLRIGWDNLSPFCGYDHRKVIDNRDIYLPKPQPHFTLIKPNPSWSTALEQYRDV